MTLNRKRKAFTIVELVIVIAVIAILAAVLIPTFASIISRANQSADIQAVRQMNMALMAESAIKAPEGIEDVIQILADAGYNAKEKLTPVSTGHGFYWCKSANLIALIKDEGDNTPKLIFPLDNETLEKAVTDAADNWNGALTATDPVFYDLEPSAEEFLPEIEEENAGEGIKDAASLKAALEAGGTVQLGAPIELADPVTIPDGVTVTLDLNGKTLTIGSDTEPAPSLASLDASDAAAVALSETSGPSISVSGTLNINGGTIFTTAGYNGDTPLGLVVNSTGTLKLNNMTVTVGTGATHALYNDGGEVTATDCIFNEAAGAKINYRYGAPILNVGGTIEMKSVDISSSNYCTSGYPSNTWGTITIDENSTLTLTGEKNVAPRGDYYAYNVYWGDPTNNELLTSAGEIVFKCDAPADEDVSKDVTITLTEDKTWDMNRYFAEKVTIDLSGRTLTLSDTCITCEELIITDSEGDGTLELKSGYGYDFEDFFDVTKLTLSGKAGNNLKVSQNGIGLSKITEIIQSGVVLENCLFNESIAVNSERTIVLHTGCSLGTSLDIPGGEITIDLNGNTLAMTGNNTIKVPNNSTLNIKNGNITRQNDEDLFVAGTDSNMGKVNLENVTLKHDAFLSHIMENENTNITASNVSINDKATLTKKVDNNDKIKTTLTLDAGFTLPCNLTVSNGNTLAINLNGNMLSTGDKVITVSGDGSTLTVNGVNGGTVFAGAVPFKTENGGDMSLTDVTVTVSTDQQFFFALLADVMGCHSASDIKYGYLIVDKEEGNETTITIDQGIGDAHFSLSNEMIIPAGCVVTMNLNDRGLDLRGKITIGGTFTMNNGSLHAGEGKFTVERTGTLNLAAKNYYRSTTNSDHCDNESEVQTLANAIVDNTNGGTFNLIYPPTTAS